MGSLLIFKLNISKSLLNWVDRTGVCPVIAAKPRSVAYSFMLLHILANLSMVINFELLFCLTTVLLVENNDLFATDLAMFIVFVGTYLSSISTVKHRLKITAQDRTSRHANYLSNCAFHIRKI